MLVLRGCFDGPRNKELKNKNRHCLKAMKKEKLGKSVKKLSDV
jgi:hypothetical protein